MEKLSGDRVLADRIDVNQSSVLGVYLLSVFQPRTNEWTTTVPISRAILPKSPSGVLGCCFQAGESSDAGDQGRERERRSLQTE